MGLVEDEDQEKSRSSVQLKDQLKKLGASFKCAFRSSMRRVLVHFEEDEAAQPVQDLPCYSTIQVKLTVILHGGRQLRQQLWLSAIQRYHADWQAEYHGWVQQELPAAVEGDIVKDCHRTFPNQRRFISLEGRDALHNVLHAYAAFDPLVGYCQGMNFVAGVLLLYLEHEADAFAALALLLKLRGLAGLYSPSMPLLQEQLWQLGRLLPATLTAHFEACGVVPVLFAASWFMTCFSADFPISFSARVMDVLLQGHCSHTTLKVALALLQYAEKDLLALKSMEDMLGYLKTTLPSLPQDRLHDVLHNAFSDPWTFQQLAMLDSKEGQETVAESMERVSKLSAQDSNHNHHKANNREKKTPSSPRLSPRTLFSRWPSKNKVMSLVIPAVDPALESPSSSGNSLPSSCGVYGAPADQALQENGSRSSVPTPQALTPTGSAGLPPRCTSLQHRTSPSAMSQRQLLSTISDPLLGLAVGDKRLAPAAATTTSRQHSIGHASILQQFESSPSKSSTRTSAAGMQRADSQAPTGVARAGQQSFDGQSIQGDASKPNDGLSAVGTMSVSGSGVLQRSTSTSGHRQSDEGDKTAQPSITLRPSNIMVTRSAGPSENGAVDTATRGLKFQQGSGYSSHGTPNSQVSPLPSPRRLFQFGGSTGASPRHKHHASLDAAMIWQDLVGDAPLPESMMTGRHHASATFGEVHHARHDTSHLPRSHAATTCSSPVAGQQRTASWNDAGEQDVHGVPYSAFANYAFERIVSPLQSPRTRTSAHCQQQYGHDSSMPHSSSLQLPPGHSMDYANASVTPDANGDGLAGDILRALASTTTNASTPRPPHSGLHSRQGSEVLHQSAGGTRHPEHHNHHNHNAHLPPLHPPAPVQLPSTSSSALNSPTPTSTSRVHSTQVQTHHQRRASASPMAGGNAHVNSLPQSPIRPLLQPHHSYQETHHANANASTHAHTHSYTYAGVQYDSVRVNRPHNPDILSIAPGQISKHHRRHSACSSPKLTLNPTHQRAVTAGGIAELYGLDGGHSRQFVVPCEMDASATLESWNETL